MKTQTSLLAAIVIVLFFSEGYAQNPRLRIGIGYEYTGAASPLTRSNAATVEFQAPIGESRFSRISSLSFGGDEAGFYGRPPGGLTLSVLYILASAIGNRSTSGNVLRAMIFIPDGLRFDFTRRNHLRAGIYGNFLTFDYRHGDLYYAPDVGLRTEFQISGSTFLFVKGAAKHFVGDNNGWAPQVAAGIGRSF